MPGFKLNGVDLDTIFEPHSNMPSLDYASNVGFTYNGTDLSRYYMPLKYGSKTASLVDFLANGVDLRDIFAAKGSVSYVLQLHITSNQFAMNLKSWADAQIGTTDYSRWQSVQIYIDSGVSLGGSSSTSYSVRTGSFPIPLEIINNGHIYGRGGSGGGGGTVRVSETTGEAGTVWKSTWGTGGSGGAGYDGLYLDMNITLINNGLIYGGGGGGYGSSGYSNVSSSGSGTAYSGSGGGGGAGYPGGGGGAAGGITDFRSNGSDVRGNAGHDGTTSGGGTGGSGTAGVSAGENGGTWATASDGAAGRAIIKNGHALSLTNNGTIKGSIV